MKAVSPLLSRPGSGGLLPGRTTRGKSPVLPEEGLSDMERCYRLLRAMVPGLRPDRSLSRVDLLQHVIDYILDLQTALEPGPTVGRPQNQNLRDREDPHEDPHEDRGPQLPPTSARSPSRSWNPDLRPDRRTFSTRVAGLQAPRGGS